MKPNTECFAVIFTSTRTEGDNGYAEASERMMQRVAEQPGFSVSIRSVGQTEWGLRFRTGRVRRRFSPGACIRSTG